MRTSSWLLAILAGVAGACIAGLGHADILTALAWGGWLGCAAGVGMAWLDWRDFVAEQRANRAEKDAKTARIKAETAILLAQVAEAEPEAPAEPDVAVSQSWRIMAHRFLAGAVRHGWTIRRMVDAGIVTWDGWLAMTDELVRLGVMVKSPRAGWALGWSWERWLTDCRALPWPDSEPPAVEISTTQQGNNGHNSAPEGVEGVAIDA